MIDAVCGFFFDEARTRVALIRKTKPDWQKGKLNGIGGKVESYERSPYATMVREFHEEAGLETQREDWFHYFTLTDKQNGYRIWYFVTHGDLAKLKSMEEEQIEIIQLGGLNVANVVHNLTWLIPMALDTTFKNGSGEWSD